MEVEDSGVAVAVVEDVVDVAEEGITGCPAEVEEEEVLATAVEDTVVEEEGSAVDPSPSVVDLPTVEVPLAAVETDGGKCVTATPPFVSPLPPFQTMSRPSDSLLPISKAFSFYFRPPLIRVAHRHAVLAIDIRFVSRQDKTPL